MTALLGALQAGRVPASWMACMSTRIQEVLGLQAWFADVLARHRQLVAWTAGGVVPPHSIWLPGLFNRERAWGPDVAELLVPCTVHALSTQACPLHSPNMRHLPAAKACLTAVLQQYARQRGLPLDIMRFLVEVTDKQPGAVAEPPAEGLFVHGLTIEGEQGGCRAAQGC